MDMRSFFGDAARVRARQTKKRTPNSPVVPSSCVEEKSSRRRQTSTSTATAAVVSFSFPFFNNTTTTNNNTPCIPSFTTQSHTQHQMLCCFDSPYYSPVRANEQTADSPDVHRHSPRSFPGMTRTLSSQRPPHDSILIKTGGNALQAVPREVALAEHMVAGTY